MTASLTKWYEENGRHAIYAGGKAVPLPDVKHSLALNEDHVNRGPQVAEGPQNARDEKAMKRDSRQDAEMMKLYRQHVLKEQAVDLVQIGTPKPAAKPKVAEPERELVAGD